EVAGAPGAGVDVGGRAAFGGPAGSEDGVGCLSGGAAECPTEAEEVPDAGGDDVGRGFLGGGEDDDPGGAAAGDEIPEEFGQPVALFAVAASEVEGEFVEDDDVEAEAVVGGDLAAAPGEEFGVAAVHLGPELFEDRDRLGEIRADEPSGARCPWRQLDPLAIEEPEADGRVKGGGGDEEGKGDGLAGAGLSAEQDIVFGQRDGDMPPVLVDADRDRFPQVPRSRFTQGRGQWNRRVEGIATDDGNGGERSVRPVLGDPYLGDAH